MKFNLKIKLNDDSILTPGNISRSVARIWEKIRTLLFFAILIVAVLAGFVIWQQSLSNTPWSQQKKQDYLNIQNKGVVFKEAEFKKALDDLQMRKNENDSAYVPVKDIFAPYK